MSHYKLIKTSVSINEDIVDTYGIKYNNKNDNLTIEDISPNKELVAEIVKMCNKYKLSPNQLKDVIEDNLL